MSSSKKPRPPALHTACMTGGSADTGSSRVTKDGRRKSTPSTPSSASVFITTNPILLTNGGGTAEVSAEERRAIRAQAARSSAAARTATLAKKRADKRRQESKDYTPPTPLTPSTSNVERRESGHDELLQAAHQSVLEEDQDRQLVVDAQKKSRRRPSKELRLDDTAGLVITPHARSMLSAATSDPFNALPHANWHVPSVTTRRDSTTGLVDHYLTHFAPARIGTTEMHGREAIRLQLWPFVMSNSQLFEAILLIAGTHLSLSGGDGPTQAGILNLRHNALQSINQAISSAQGGLLDPAVIGAIGLLAGWELEFGAPQAYDTHMAALKAIVTRQYSRAGREKPPTETHQATLPPIIEDLLISMGHDLPAFSSKQLYFPRADKPAMFQACPDPTGLPVGFRTVIEQRLFIPDLLHRVSQLQYFDPGAPDAAVNLRSIARSISQYDHYAGFGTSYSFLQTQQEDEMNAQSVFHVRLAGLALCGALRKKLPPTTTPLHEIEFYMDARGGPSVLSKQAAALMPKYLVGTVYDEILLWALVAIVAVTGTRTSQQTRALSRLFADCQIRELVQLEMRLSNYVFPFDMLKWQVLEIFRAATAPSATSSPGSQQTSPTESSAVAAVTRYNRSVRHPTVIADLIESGVGEAKTFDDF